jgi:hypothetical protein
MADHDLAIDEIFGATEGNETDFDAHERDREKDGTWMENVEAGIRKNRGFFEPRFLKVERAVGLLLGALGLLGGEGDSDLAALEIGFAAFTFDDLVGLLAHGIGIG